MEKDIEKVCNHCGEQNEQSDSFAMELLKGYSAQAKRWFIACLTILFMWLATIGLFVWYLNQYDFESVTTTVDADNGVANYIGNDGDIYNGKDYSKENISNQEE